MAFNTPSCPKCGMLGVTMLSNAKGKFLAHVASYPSGHYYRALHTFAECDANAAKADADAHAAIAKREADNAAGDAIASKVARTHVLVARFKAIYGDDAAKAAGAKILDRWMGF